MADEDKITVTFSLRVTRTYDATDIATFANLGRLEHVGESALTDTLDEMIRADAIDAIRNAKGTVKFK